MYKEAPEVINRNVSQENLQRNSCCCGQCGVEGREWEMGRNGALSMASKKHIMVFSVHQFSVVILLLSFLFSLPLYFGGHQGLGHFSIFECCFGSFLNLKDKIFYNNSQINTSNSDFLPKHIWTYPKIKIYFDPHPFFSFSFFSKSHWIILRSYWLYFKMHPKSKYPFLLETAECEIC